MRDSLRLGKFAGISVGLHWSIALIAGLFVITLAGTILPATVPGYATAAYLAVAVATTVAFLGSIIAHELGHSVVAERNGVGVAGITLFALGGVAKLEGEPRTPGVAARIALAGPAVSVAIGVAALIFAASLGAIGLSPVLVAGITWLGIVNIIMAVFNMVPALPLDGGRVLQAALWKRNGNQHEATISAATLGRYIGFALIAFGLWQFLGGGSGLWTALIGWFVASSARAEAFHARRELEREQVNPFEWNPWASTGPSHPPPDPAQRVIDVEGRPVR